jgi:hypothetical protein
MITTPLPTRAALQVDPKIVKKTRRLNAAYAYLGGRPASEYYDYMQQPERRLLAPRYLEFGRPGLHN